MADLWYNMYFSLVKRHSEKLTGQLSFIFKSPQSGHSLSVTEGIYELTVVL